MTFMGARPILQHREFLLTQAHAMGRMDMRRHYATTCRDGILMCVIHPKHLLNVVPLELSVCHG